MNDVANNQLEQVIEPLAIEPQVIETQVIGPQAIKPQVIGPQVIDAQVIGPIILEPKAAAPILPEPAATVRGPRARKILLGAAEILLILVILGLLAATWLPAWIGAHAGPSWR
jgi:hypothetical protein